MADTDSSAPPAAAVDLPPPPPLPVPEPRKDWKFTQWFKKMPTQGMQPDADTLSAVSFDHDGKFLATGDRGGRIVVMESDPVLGKQKPGGVHFKFHAEFQSHEAEFDYVRSLAVEERISKIKWLPATNDALFLLSTNDRAIKLWKVHRKAQEAVQQWNVDPATGELLARSVGDLQLPRAEQIDFGQPGGAGGGGGDMVVATLKRNYSPDVHAFHINSLAVCSDGETFLSGDNLRINFWNANYADKAFNVIDTKPTNMQDLTEVITCADFHPTECNQFLFASSKGMVRLGDTRERAVLDHMARVFACPEPSSSATPTLASQQNQDKSFFSDVTLSISDARFTPNGQQVVTRDFMTVKVWDLRQERKPVEVISVHEYLRPKLWDLYENDCVYDGFELGISREGNICTGSYNNYFHIYDLKNPQNKTDTWAEASKVPIGVYGVNANLWKADANRIFANGAGGAQGGSAGGAQANKNKKRNSRTGPRSLFSRKPKTASSAAGTDLQGVDEAGQLILNGGGKDGAGGLVGPIPPTVNPETLDYGNKVLHCAWHPQLNAIAVAGANNLFLYAQHVHQPPAASAVMTSSNA